MPLWEPLSAITFLKSKDLEETTHFYLDLLGFKLVLDQVECRIFRVCTNCYLGFCLTQGSTGSDEVILTLEIPDVDGFYCDIINKGVTIETMPRLNEKFNIYQMFLRDPNGYLIEVQRFLDPAWEISRQNGEMLRKTNNCS